MNISCVDVEFFSCELLSTRHAWRNQILRFVLELVHPILLSVGQGRFTNTAVPTVVIPGCYMLVEKFLRIKRFKTLITCEVAIMSS